jgi:Phage Mu protein F like protein
MALETQEEILARIDEQSRVALEDAMEADVQAVVDLYQQALDEIEAQVANVWRELASTPDAERRLYLEWKGDRETRLMQQIRMRMNDLRDRATAALRDGMMRSELTQTYWDAYMLDVATPPNIEIDTRTATPAIADSIVNTPWEGAMFSDRIWALTDDTVQEIQNQLSQAAILGESIDEAVRRIRSLDVLDGNVPPTYAIERLARTEISKASDRARDSLYRANSDIIEAEEFVETIEPSRTCEGCQDLDGLVVGSEEANSVIEDWEFSPRCPHHPNCRGSTIPRLKSWKDLLGLQGGEGLEDFGPTERVVRGPDGKSMIAPMETFSEWMTRRGATL